MNYEGGVSAELDEVQETRPSLWQRIANDPIGDELPEAVRRLAPREREVATTIYRHGALTAVELSRYMRWQKAHGSLRMMLHRLTAKGILERRHSGYGKTFLYVPALGRSDRAELAFKRLAEDFYDGSLGAAATDILHFLARRARQRDA